MTTTEYWAAVLLVVIGIAATVPVALLVIGVAPATRIDRVSQLVASCCAVLSLLVPSGATAAMLALPWLTVALGAAGRTGTATLRTVLGRRRRARRFDALLPLVAVLWWVNAAAWLVAHRAGIEPLGFDRAITLLTVGHFHHAGIGLTALLVGAHQRLGEPAVTRTIVLIQQLGMLMVAAGISVSDHLEVAGAATITVSLAGWAWLALVPLRRMTPDPRGRVLLTMSAGSWVVPMGLALAWAAGPFLADPVVRTFETMLRFHGAINALGLVLAGLVALRLAATDVRTLGKDHDDHLHTAHR